MLAGEVVLKVTPEQLKEKSVTVEAQIKVVQNSFEELKRRINATSSYWIGEAGDLHRKLYNDEEDTINEMMRRLKEHPRDLITIADTYIGAENEAKSIADQLTGDVIE